MAAGASTAAAVDTAARFVEVERGSTERRRGAEWAMRMAEERPRGRVGARRKGRCHSCGRREATDATGFGIPPCPGGGGRSRGFCGLGLGRLRLPLPLVLLTLGVQIGYLMTVFLLKVPFFKFKIVNRPKFLHARC